MILACTGHRPDKLPDKKTGYILPNPTYIKICRETEKILKELKPDKCISGMALGYDSYCANICIKLGIPFIAAVPFKDQDKVWPDSSKRIYHKLLSKAESVVIVSEGEYSAEKLQIRNEWMVDNANILLACWNKSKGGTANCINYAKSVGRDIVYIDPTL